MQGDRRETWGLLCGCFDSLARFASPSPPLALCWSLRMFVALYYFLFGQAGVGEAPFR